MLFLRSRLPGTPLEFQRFLICQDAVLAPVYAEFDGLPKGPRDKHRLENEMLAGGLSKPAAAKAADVVRILNFTFDRLVECV